jgi:hypothetical protein
VLVDELASSAGTSSDTQHFIRTELSSNAGQAITQLAISQNYFALFLKQIVM